LCLTSEVKLDLVLTIDWVLVGVPDSRSCIKDHFGLLGVKGQRKFSVPFFDDSKSCLQTFAERVLEFAYLQNDYVFCVCYCVVVVVFKADNEAVQNYVP